MQDRALLRHTSLRRYVKRVDWSGFGAAVSLHAHTFHSREVMSDIPAYVTRIPFLGRRFESEVDRRRGTDSVFTHLSSLGCAVPGGPQPIPFTG